MWDAALSTAELDAVRLGGGLPANPAPLISMMRTWCDLRYDGGSRPRPDIRRRQRHLDLRTAPTTTSAGAQAAQTHQ